MWECVRCLVLFCCLLERVFGIARATRPLVFSYSGNAPTLHPAIISHHYHEPTTAAPVVVVNRAQPTVYHVEEPITGQQYRTNSDAHFNDLPVSLDSTSQPPYEDYDYTTVPYTAPRTINHSFVDQTYQNTTDFSTKPRFLSAQPTKYVPRLNHETSTVENNEAPLDYPFAQVVQNYDDLGYTDYGPQDLPPITNYPPPDVDYVTTSRAEGGRPRSEMPLNDMSEQDDAVTYLSDKVLRRPMHFAYSNDIPQEQTDSGQKSEKHEKGGGQDHKSAHAASTGHKGDKGYKTSHENSEGKKGHHDKESHKGKYADEKGKKAKNKEEGGHFDKRHRKEKGRKAAEFDEAGRHKKGHSTKGEHNVHKKDEYVKKYEFYDEHHEGGEHEKLGGFAASHKRKKGGKKKKGHHKSAGRRGKKGEKGSYEKGSKSKMHKGHEESKGYDGHFASRKKFGKKGGLKKAKKWGHSSGHPE